MGQKQSREQNREQRVKILGLLNILPTTKVIVAVPVGLGFGHRWQTLYSYNIFLIVSPANRSLQEKLLALNKYYIIYKPSLVKLRMKDTIVSAFPYFNLFKYTERRNLGWHCLDVTRVTYLLVKCTSHSFSTESMTEQIR